LKLPFDFGKYVLEELLGSGGMGNVYRARRKSDGEDFAVKTIHSHLTQLKNFMDRFHREAKLLKKLAHPRVVRIYDNGVYYPEGEDPVHFIVMEYVIGGSLTDVITGKHTDTDTKKMTLSVKLDGKERTVVMAKGVTRMLRQLAAILQEAHQLGIVHRDIKPDNIYITSPEWDVKLLDFGIARDSHDLQVSISQTGNVLGTPPYMSPEQCEGNTDIDIRSDLYALGVVAYECLSGTLPFTGPTTMAFLQQHLHMNPVPLLTMNPNLPRWLCCVVERLLAKERLMRHQTPLELAEDLNRIERGWPPLKIYDFEKRELVESAAKGGERITPSSDKIPQAPAMPQRAKTPQPGGTGIRKREEPLPPPPVKVEKKSSFLPVALVVIAVIAVATYFLAPVLLIDETKRQPTEETSKLQDPPKLMDTDDAALEMESHRSVNEGEEAMKDKRYADAVAAFTNAHGLIEDDRVKAKLEEAQKALEAEKLAKQRQEDFDRLVSEGDSASSKSDWDRAITSYNEALKLFNDSTVRTKLAHTKSERDIQLRDQQRQAKLAQEISNGDRAVESGDYSKARQHYSEAAKLSGEGANTSLLELLEQKTSSASKLADAKSRMDKAKTEYDYQAEADALKDFLSERDIARYRTRLRELERLASLVREMKKAESEKNWMEMKRTAEELDKENYPPAKNAITEAEEEIQVGQLCKLIEAAEKATEYATALLKLKELKEIRPDDKYLIWEQTIKDKMAAENEEQRFNRYISEAEKALNENRARDAMSNARSACSISPDNEKAKELLKRSISMNQRDMAKKKLERNAIAPEGASVTSLDCGENIVVWGAGPSATNPNGNGTIYAMEKGKLRVLAQNAHSSVISGLEIWRDRIISASFDGTVKVWDLKYGFLRETIAIKEQVWALAVSDKYVLAGTNTGQIAYIDMATWRKTGEVKLGKPVRSIACSDRFAFVTNGSEVIKLSLPDMKKQASQSVTGNARGLVVLGENRLAVGDSKGEIHILNQNDLSPVRKWKAHAQFITALATSADSSIVVSSSMDGTVAFWNVDDGEEIGRLKDAGLLIRELVFTPDTIYGASEIGGLVILKP